MPETIKDRWIKLCEQARQEMDSAKLIELVSQINALMEEDERARQNLPGLSSSSGESGNSRSASDAR